MILLSFPMDVDSGHDPGDGQRFGYGICGSLETLIFSEKHSRGCLCFFILCGLMRLMVGVSDGGIWKGGSGLGYSL